MDFRKQARLNMENSNSINGNFFDSVMRLQRNMKRCSEIINPNSYGRGQGKALRFIAEEDGITVQQLANRMDIRPSSLSGRLRILESDHNIKKVRDESDARVVHLYITQKGLETLKNRKSGEKKTEIDFCDCLTKEEQKQFIDMCNRLSDHLAKIKEADEKRKKELIRSIS